MKSRKNHITETATIMFMQSGLRRVTVDDIASYTGISKKTLYERFHSKEMLVTVIVQEFILKTSKYIRICLEVEQVDFRK